MAGEEVERYVRTPESVTGLENERRVVGLIRDKLILNEVDYPEFNHKSL